MREISKEKILEGDKRALAQAITLIESSLTKDQKASEALLEGLMPHTGNSIRIGISGPPGVGKSTFIESFGLFLLSLQKKVAVLAVDPSSPVSGGSLLADKTRMEKLSNKERAFIRPAPNSGSQGVGLRTRETILLCEASGYEILLLETVGVGQADAEVTSMVDFFLLLLPPGAGDELQSIKRGLIELAHVILITKAAGDLLALAKTTALQHKNALELTKTQSFWKPCIFLHSALEKSSSRKVWESVETFIKEARGNGHFEKNRNQQKKQSLERPLLGLVKDKIFSSREGKEFYEQQIQAVIQEKTTPYLAAQRIVDFLLK